MRIRPHLAAFLALALAVAGGALTADAAAPARPQGPCDIYGAAGDPCVAAHSTTRALYGAYKGPLYQVLRQSDGKLLNIGVVAASAADAGGYANAAAQDAFCANTICWITRIYDQSPRHNDLFQAPRGAFSGPAMGGFNNLPIADMAPVTVMGHKVYGVYIMPGMGLRRNDPTGTAVDDQAEGEYWVIDGHHFNNGCCFDYGNAEIDSKDDGNGTMETTYYGNATPWYHGNLPGPWVMTDQENNLVGCVNPGSTSKVCTGLPDITWRFVTGMAKGEPHHWASLGGDAQKGPLQVMFDGPRVDITYDPMRKQGAILLGNGGDNSNSSQGTFYEGAMTESGTFPTHATDQLVQANVVAAGYNVARLTLAPASAAAAPPGLQSFAPGSSQDTMVRFTNTTGMPVTDVKLSLSLPKGWTATLAAAPATGPVAPDTSVTATFHVTAGPSAFNGDLVATATYMANGKTQSDKAFEKLRNASPVKINEFRVSDGSVDTTNSFIELTNAGTGTVDISGWTLTQHPAQQAIFGNVKIPAGIRLASHGFYLLGLAGSGLAAPARAGDSTIHVRSIVGLSVGDTISVDTGTGLESRRITAIGSAAGSETTLWQPAEDPTLVIPAGATNVPVTSIAGFAVGEKIALGYGTAGNAVARTTEKLEVATVTAIGTPGTQAFLGADAAAGASNISVTSVANIRAGDKIRLDIGSVGHGVETVTVKSVGTPANWLALAGDAKAGVATLRLRRGTGVFNGASAGNFSASAVGHKLIVGMPGKLETVTITAMTADSATVSPALSRDHLASEPVVDPGTGLDLVAPLKFSHSGNLSFSTRGTGITFTPATKFAHANNEPVQPMGTGITLDKPLARAHAIHAAVRDAASRDAGYQGARAPDQWFGGPVLSTSAGSMVLRDAAGHVVDSLNYGLLTDPWASEGYQTVSGTGQLGCRVTAPGIGRAQGRGPFPVVNNTSAGRLPDGADSDSNCTDFRVQPATVLAAASAVGATNIKVASVADFTAGQTVMLDADANQETAVITTVGTAGATTTTAAAAAGDSDLDVAGTQGFIMGQTITIDRETAVVAAARGGPGGNARGRITVTKPLSMAHASGARVSGSGITLGSGLGKAHASGTQVLTNAPTPGAPNKY
jgi:hypothetical protein